MAYLRVPLFIAGVLLIAFFIRIQGVSILPDQQFTESDAYLYYWYAQIISDHGHLPERDMHRWLPLGRDLKQTLNLYSYAIAYAHKTVTLVFSNISLYHVALYMPVACFCIGLGALCLFLFHTYGPLFSSTVGVLLATLPGSIERSAAGFGDRDAWCLMLGILAVISYLVSLQAQSPRRRLLWTLASGFIVFLGGLSWEGFGMFLGIILVVELWRFLSTPLKRMEKGGYETETELGYYFLWVCTFVPTLYFASSAYRSGYGFAKHLAAFVLVPPVVLLIVRSLRYLLVSKVEKLRPYARTLAFGLILIGIGIALSYVFTQYHTFASTTVPFSQTPLMQTVSELETPQFNYWKIRFGGTFVFCCLSVLFTTLDLCEKRGAILFGAPIILFCCTTFFRQPLDKVWGVSLGNIFFGIALTWCVIAFLLIAWRRKAHASNEWTYVAFIAWFLAWVALSRDAKRYDFFIGVSLAFFTAELVRQLSNSLCDRLKNYFPLTWLRISITSILLLAIMFFPPLGGHMKHTLFASTQLRKAIHGNNSYAKAFEWINLKLPSTAVVAANWSYGSLLNVLGGVKTITDQDHYIQRWIHFYNRHIYHAQSGREVLVFLKSHNVTHLMLTKNEPINFSFLPELSGRAFVPVYPIGNFAEAEVKVWEIHYPLDIQPNPKYLETGIPEIDAHLHP